MALSSQDGLNFHQSRLQDSTESARGALTEFGSLAQRFQDNKLKAEALAEAKAQQAIENARADRAEAMQKEQFEMRKKEFDTMQNTLRATALGTTTFDKASLGQALLDKQAASIGGSDGNGNFNNKLLQESQALAAKYQPITNADGTSTAVEMNKADAARFKAIQDELGSQADKMIAANKGNMQVQKQLIGEVGNQYFKEGEDGPMLYDPTSLNKYKQDLLQGLDTRIDREAARAQRADEFNREMNLRIAQHNEDKLRQSKTDQALIKAANAGNAYDFATRPVTEGSKAPIMNAEFARKYITPYNDAKREYSKIYNAEVERFRKTLEVPKGQRVAPFSWKGKVDLVMRDGKGVFVPKAGAKVRDEDLKMLSERFNTNVIAKSKPVLEKISLLKTQIMNPDVQKQYVIPGRTLADIKPENRILMSGEAYKDKIISRYGAEGTPMFNKGLAYMNASGWTKDIDGTPIPPEYVPILQGMYRDLGAKGYEGANEQAYDASSSSLKTFK